MADYEFIDEFAPPDMWLALADVEKTIERMRDGEEAKTVAHYVVSLGVHGIVAVTMTATVVIGSLAHQEGLTAAQGVARLALVQGWRSQSATVVDGALAFWSGNRQQEVIAWIDRMDDEQRLDFSLGLLERLNYGVARLATMSDASRSEWYDSLLAHMRSG